MKYLNPSLFAVCASAVLSGCGAGHHDVSSTTPSGAGRAELRVLWPVRTEAATSRHIPYAAEQLRVSVYLAATNECIYGDAPDVCRAPSVRVYRPANPTEESVAAFNDLPTRQSLTLKASAYAATNNTGTAFVETPLASGSGALGPLSPGTTTPATVNLAATAARLRVYQRDVVGAERLLSDSQTATVGTITLAPTARGVDRQTRLRVEAADSAGSIVLLSRAGQDEVRNNDNTQITWQADLPAVSFVQNVLETTVTRTTQRAGVYGASVTYNTTDSVGSNPVNNPNNLTARFQIKVAQETAPAFEPLDLPSLPVLGNTRLAAIPEDRGKLFLSDGNRVFRITPGSAFTLYNNGANDFTLPAGFTAPTTAAGVSLVATNAAIPFAALNVSGLTGFGLADYRKADGSVVNSPTPPDATTSVLNLGQVFITAASGTSRDTARRGADLFLLRDDGFVLSNGTMVGFPPPPPGLSGFRFLAVADGFDTSGASRAVFVRATDTNLVAENNGPFVKSSDIVSGERIGKVMGLATEGGYVYVLAAPNADGSGAVRVLVYDTGGYFLYGLSAPDARLNTATAIAALPDPDNSGSGLVYVLYKTGSDVRLLRYRRPVLEP